MHAALYFKNDPSIHVKGLEPSVRIRDHKLFHIRVAHGGLARRRALRGALICKDACSLNSTVLYIFVDKEREPCLLAIDHGIIGPVDLIKHVIALNLSS